MRSDGEILNVGSTDTIDIETLAELVHNGLAPELEYTEAREADAEHIELLVRTGYTASV